MFYFVQIEYLRGFNKAITFSQLKNYLTIKFVKPLASFSLKSFSIPALALKKD